MSKEKNNKQIRLAARPRDYERWKAAADELTGGNVSAFLRFAANEKARELESSRRQTGNQP